jgi:hypothetical protein
MSFFLKLLKLFFFGRHRATFISATARAGVMGLRWLSALRTSGQVQSLDFLMGAALTAFRFGNLMLWNRHE